MKSELRELLDKIYELEGLVHLALKRDEIANDILRLVSKKSTEVSAICDKFSHPAPPVSTDEPEVLNLITKDIPGETVQPHFLLDEYCLDEEPADITLGLSDKDTKPFVGESSSVTTTSEVTDYNRQQGKLVFSINDRFRFRKELFGNSDADFNTSLALVASMDDYEEAEDYFINEEGFERNNPVVAEFLEIVKKYFK